MSSAENPQTARLVSDSQSEMTEIILPNDTNTLGNLLGGRLMHFIDITGAMAAYRHTHTHVVTAAMDHIDFIYPVHVGDLLILKASVNRAFRTSLEVGVKAWVENTFTGTRLHVASAYLVFVAIDKNGRRVEVPELKPVTADEQRRYADALLRREHREAEAKRRKKERQAAAQVAAATN
jgi:acyl-CoA hydrolase